LAGWTLEEDSELIHGTQAAFRGKPGKPGKPGQIATLEFLQYHFP